MTDLTDKAIIEELTERIIKLEEITGIRMPKYSPSGRSAYDLNEVGGFAHDRKYKKFHK